MIFEARDMKLWIDEGPINCKCSIKPITRSNKMEKNYSLLRPFDLEAAKRGENICTDIGVEVEFIAAAGPSRLHAIRGIDGNIGSAYSNMMRMSPLAWVEGRPVYRGDVLYINDISKTDIVTGADNFEIEFRNSGNCYADNRNKNLTWQKPKTKREGWVNILPANYHKYPYGYIYPSEQEAKESAPDYTIATAYVSWEE